MIETLTTSKSAGVEILNPNDVSEQLIEQAIRNSVTYCLYKLGRSVSQQQSRCAVNQLIDRIVILRENPEYAAILASEIPNFEMSYPIDENFME